MQSPRPSADRVKPSPFCLYTIAYIRWLRKPHSIQLGRALERAIGTNRDVELAYAAHLRALDESRDPQPRGLIHKVRLELTAFSTSRAVTP